MKQENLDLLVKDGKLRIRDADKEKIKSLLNSSETTIKFVFSVKLNEISATSIFREVYESIRQLGEAKWWLSGYEPIGAGTHDTVLEVLREMNIKEKTKLNFLERFKRIRHDANYRGYKVTVAQAQEILDFWNEAGKEILETLKKDSK